MTKIKQRERKRERRQENEKHPPKPNKHKRGGKNQGEERRKNIESKESKELMRNGSPPTPPYYMSCKWHSQSAHNNISSFKSQQSSYCIFHSR
jgi:hypothetical protein